MTSFIIANPEVLIGAGIVTTLAAFTYGYYRFHKWRDAKNFHRIHKDKRYPG